jgi:hypothetical protein
VGIHSFTLRNSGTIKGSCALSTGQRGLCHYDVDGTGLVVISWSTRVVDTTTRCSQSGCTAQDIAEQLNFDDIIDALKSKTNLELGTCCYYNVSIVTHTMC